MTTDNFTDAEVLAALNAHGVVMSPKMHPAPSLDYWGDKPAEAMRAASLRITPRAMLTRAVSVIRGRTLIINLPGSPKACMECMDVFLDTIPHAMGLLRGAVEDCARK